MSPTRDGVKSTTLGLFYRHLYEPNPIYKAQLLQRFHAGVLTLKLVGVSAVYDDRGYLTGWKHMKRNAVHCNHCDTTIESLHRHDFVRCGCPENMSVFVDGGFDYQRVGFGSLADFTVIDEEYVAPLVPTLEHTDTQLVNVHHPSRCAGDHCTLHNRSNHSKRSWVQRWDPYKGMRRISPVTGRSYRDPDEL